jgi:hypothetical protein
VPRTSLIEAGTFMHELGHNLGLQHGGADEQNRKPNYLSVMNYLYQFDGLQRTGRTGVIDYARFRVGQVAESNLSDSAGFPLVTSPPEPLDDVITTLNPNYCRRRAVGDDCATGRLRGQVPGAMTFSGVARCWSSRRCDLNGNGSRTDVFAPVQNDWQAIKLNPSAAGVSRFVVDQDSRCGLPADENEAPTDEFDQPEAGETAGEQPPVETPPVEQPPMDEPPVAEPPVEQPPMDEPPVDEPPFEQPPMDEPPVDEPPFDEPPPQGDPGEPPPDEDPFPGSEF